MKREKPIFKEVVKNYIEVNYLIEKRANYINQWLANQEIPGIDKRAEFEYLDEENGLRFHWYDCEDNAYYLPIRLLWTDNLNDYVKELEDKHKDLVKEVNNEIIKESDKMMEYREYLRLKEKFEGVLLK